MLGFGYATVILAGLLFGASKLQQRGQRWADEVCYYAFGLCDEAQWLMIASAFFALAAVARTTIRTQ
jgi:hypothetical protein